MQMRHHTVWPEGLPHTLEPLPGSLFDNLRNTAKRQPDSLALIYYGRTYTYAELLKAVESLAGYLATDCGVGPGDRVLLYVQNSPQLIIGYYAILAANAVVVPVNPMSRKAELGHIATDSGARAILLGSENVDQIAALLETSPIAHAICGRYGDEISPDNDMPLPDAVTQASPVPQDQPGITPWDKALAANRAAPSHTAGPDDWAVIPYSSGTTGKPKGCLHSHATTNAVVHSYSYWIEMPSESRILATLPLFHVTGMQNSMNVPIYVGATIVLMTRWDRDVAIQLIEENKVSSWRSITASAVDFIALPDLEKRDLSSLVSIGGGGAQMPEACALKLKELTGLDFIEAYGLSETIAATHINPVSAPKPQCLGVPIFGVDCRIFDPKTGETLGPNEVGEIITHAPQVFLGYWNNAEATEAVFLNLDGKRFLRTGDMGYYDEDGYFFYVDRLKRMINAAGYKVWPAEVEAMLYDHPAIREACIIGVPDKRRGETVKAVIVVSADQATPETDDLDAWCRERMSSYKVPRVFEFVDSLPRTSMGKILWRALS